MKAEFKDVDHRDRRYLVQEIADVLTKWDVEERVVDDINQAFRDASLDGAEIGRHTDIDDWMDFSRFDD